MTHDPKLVAHLRSALDEVAARPVAHTEVTAPTRRALDARRWVAIAASVVIVAGAAVGIAMYRGDDTKVSSGASTTTAPGTAGEMPYFLAAADLAPGAVTEVPGTGGGPVVIAWARHGDMSDGLLVLQAPTGPGTPTVATSGVDADGQFSSYGLTDAERTALAAQVVPGSGLPWILPVDGWTMIAMATPSDGSTLFQSFGGTVTLAVGPMNVTLLAQVASSDTITKVAVAGQPGWQLLTPNGTTVVFWREPVGGAWVSLSIPAELADRVDGLIAAVATTNVPGITVTSDSLPPYGDGADSAIGLTAPAVIGPGLDGNAVVINPAVTQRPVLVVFVANWCPHCHALLPNVQAWIADGTISADIDVVLVTTAESASAQSSADWLAQLGWATPVLVDAVPGDGQAGHVAQAFGATGWPTLVLIDADGTVAARTAGELTQADMTAFLARASG